MHNNRNRNSKQRAGFDCDILFLQWAWRNGNHNCMVRNLAYYFRFKYWLSLVEEENDSRMKLKHLVYYPLRAYVKICLNIYFQQIEIHNYKNIPGNGPVIFLANHQNAFLDALLIVTNNGRMTHFVARAEVFKNSLAKFLMSLINMMPIYRIRDGWGSLKNNDAVFEKCYDILGSEDTLLVFPEGNHAQFRRLRPLSKGFTRIAFGTLDKYPDCDLQIIPIGINYADHQNYGSKVGLHFGEALKLRSQDLKLDHINSIDLRDQVFNSLKKLISHIESENYEETLSNLLELNPDFSNPHETNKLIESIENRDEKVISKKVKGGFKPFKILFIINSIYAYIFWVLIKRTVKDPVMLPSIKFAIAISIFPLFYLLQALLLKSFYGIAAAFSYFMLSILLAKISNWKISL